MLSTTMRSNQWAIAFAAFSIFQCGLGQEIGTDLCACQPAIYEITLDSMLTCEDRDVMGPGILTTDCLVETRLNEEANVTDFVFQTISEIQIFELDEAQDVLSQSIYNDGPYFSGDSVLYTSIIRTNPDAVTVDNFPQGFQVVITGNNKENQPLINTWGILYANDCGVFPLLTEGQVIGWSEFTDLGDPPLKFCPLVAPTMFPTSSPSIEPPAGEETSSPTKSPPTTSAPTKSPPTTSAPTKSPLTTSAPTKSPSVPPPPSATASPTPLCPPVGSYDPEADNDNMKQPTGGGSHSYNKENEGNTRGSSKKKKKSKKDYYYGSMNKVKKSKSSEGGKGGKGGKGNNSEEASTYSGRSARDLKVGNNRPTIAPSPMPSDCPEPFDPSGNMNGRRQNLRM